MRFSLVPQKQMYVILNLSKFQVMQIVYTSNHTTEGNDRMRLNTLISEHMPIINLLYNKNQKNFEKWK